MPRHHDGGLGVVKVPVHLAELQYSEDLPEENVKDVDAVAGAKTLRHFERDPHLDLLLQPRGALDRCDLKDPLD